MAGGVILALSGCTDVSTPAPLPDRLSPIVANPAAEKPASLDEARRLEHLRDYPASNRLFERYIVEHPTDADGPLFYGFSLSGQAENADDAGKARALRLQARTQLLAARKLGASDPLMFGLLEAIPADGSPVSKPPLSTDQAVSAIMSDAEKAFGRGDYARAAALHKQALGLDPKNYSAALFCGDAYFAARDFDLANEWFARAVAINPDIETAHRYWADALARKGKFTEATDQFIQAVVAEPYNRLPRERFRQFRESLGPPQRARPMNLPSARVAYKDGKVDIQIGKDDGSFGAVLELCYATVCAKVRTEDFGRLFPKETKPRRSLPEEVAGLRAMNQMAGEIAAAKNDTTKPEEAARWQPALNTLAELERDGLLEPYALLERADQELAQDYASYRSEHRDLLVRFIRHYWCGLD